MEPFIGGGVVLTLIMVCGSLLCTAIIVAVAIGVPIYIMKNNQKRAEELMAKGTQGEAKILSLQDTGMLINNQHTR